MGYSFPKQYRLRKHQEFLLVQRCRIGRKLHAEHFLFIAAPQIPQIELQIPRIGITVSKRVGNAVVRNRIKRWLREVLRQHLEWLPVGYDVVVIARRNAAELCRYDAVECEVKCLERWLVSC